MRELSSTLLEAQKFDDTDAIHKIVLSDGVDTYTYENDRILKIHHPEDPDSQTAIVELDNSDDVLTDIDLKGFEAVISTGMLTTAGEEYSAAAPLYVIAKQGYSTGGKLICELALCGIFNLMGSDEANADYNQESDDDNTIKDLLRKIAGDTGVDILDCFDHCESYDIVFDSTDSLIDVFEPKDSFNILRGETRLVAFNELLGYTGCVKRIENDGKIHIFVPKTSPSEDYDYVYHTLPENESEHVCLERSLRERIVIPSYVQVDSHPTHDETYTGSAQDDLYDSLPTRLKKHTYRYLRLANDLQAAAIATAILAHHQWEAETGSGRVMLNVGAEVHDYVQIIDEIEGTTQVGNIGYMSSDYQPGKNFLSFRFGKVYPGGLAGILPGADAGAGLPGSTTIFQYITELFDMMELVASRTLLFGVEGTLTAEDNASYEIIVPENLSCDRVYINVKTRPTGAQIIVDVNLDGDTIFSTQANRPKITPGLTVAESGKPNTVVFRKNQKLSIDIDQVGSSDPGVTLTVQIRCKLRGF